MKRPEVVVHAGLKFLPGEVALAVGRARAQTADVAELGRAHDPILRQAAVMLIGVEEGAPKSLAELARLVRAVAPQISVLAVGVRSQQLTCCVPLLALAGCDQLYELDIAGDREALAEAIRAKVDTPITREAMEPLLSRTASSPRLQSVVAWALRNGERHHAVREVVELHDWDRKTLYRRCKNLLGISFGQVLTHGRYLHAEALRAQGYTLQRIAYRMAYASPSAVGKLLAHGRARCPSG